MEACQGKALAVLTIVFLVGAGSGALGHWAAVKDADESHLDSAAHLETADVFAIDQLRDDLNLSDQQVESIQFILDQSIMVEADLMNQIRNARREGKNEIFEIFTAEQRSLFEEKMPLASSR